MKPQEYFVMVMSEDGLSVESYEKSELLEKIAENYWGKVGWLTKIPTETDTNYWQSPAGGRSSAGLILKVDRVVTPQPLSTVTSWDLP